MRSIAIINQKGGVGKTTTAVNLSVALAEAGQRVCLVDLDPQAHATLHLGMTPAEGQPSMYEVLMGEATLGESRQMTEEGLAIARSHIDLAAAEVELAGEVGRELVLRDHLAKDDQTWDYLIVDCPPSLGVLTLNALAAVGEVFLPLQPHFLALHGLSKLLGTIEVVARRLNDRLKLTGVVLCMYESGTRLAGEVSRDVNEFFTQYRRRGAPGRTPRFFKRASAATSVWRKRRALDNRSYGTRRNPTGPRTTAALPRRYWAWPRWNWRPPARPPAHCKNGPPPATVMVRPVVGGPTVVVLSVVLCISVVFFWACALTGTVWGAENTTTRARRGVCDVLARSDCLPASLSSP